MEDDDLSLGGWSAGPAQGRRAASDSDLGPRGPAPIAPRRSKYDPRTQRYYKGDKKRGKADINGCYEPDSYAGSESGEEPVARRPEATPRVKEESGLAKDPTLDKELASHKEIVISAGESFGLFFDYILCGFNSACCSSLKLYNLYLEGRTRVQKEMDLLKMMRRVRYHDLALKTSVLRPVERRTQLKHARKLLIDVDSEVESVCESEGERHFRKLDD